MKVATEEGRRAFVSTLLSRDGLSWIEGSRRVRWSWKAKIPSVLDEYHIKDYAKKVVAISVDVDPLKKYEEVQARAKRLIMDEVKDHAVPHIAKKNTASEMWMTLTTLYQGTSV